MTESNNRSVYSADMNRLIDLYKMKVKGHLLINGRCPRCGQRSLFAYVENPQLVLCGARVQCGWTEGLDTAVPRDKVDAAIEIAVESLQMLERLGGHLANEVRLVRSEMTRAQERF